MANSYLNKTMGAGNRQTWTWSAWIKRSKIGSEQNVWGVYVHGNDNMRLFFQANDVMEFKFYNGTSYKVETSRVFRDTNAWYHIVCVADTTNSTEADRLQLWVNGERQSGGGTQPTQNLSMSVNDSNAFEIGRYNSGGYFDGYMSHAALVDGQALAPTVFGETDSTSGIWKFKQPSGVTWGTNGFHLKFENSGNLGLDSSGNSNTYTVNGNGRQAVDTPSNVYATLNPLVNINSNLVLSNGNNTMTLGSTSWIGTLSSLGVDTGKWYWEIKVDANNLMHGILGETANMTELSTSNSGYIGKFSNGYAFYYQSPNARKQNNNSHATYGTAVTSGDILMVAFDATNGTIWVGKNGTWFNSATQSEIENGTTSNSMYSSIPMTETFFPGACGETNHVANYNFGNGYFGTTAITSAGSNGNGSLFEYDVPSGYYAINTKNINTYG